MAQEKLNGPVCLNHPDKLAVAHCCVCRRPICSDCLIQDSGFKCCSRECLKMAKESTQRTADVLERALARLPLYDDLNTVKITTDDLTPLETAERIGKLLM